LARSQNTDLPTEWRALAIECACNGAISDPLVVEALSVILLALSRAIVIGIPAWEADTSSPGYIRRRGSQVSVALPFHLLGDFPDTEALNSIFDFSSLVKIGDQTSTVCLSGSSTFLGTLPAAGDLDFCEYVSSDDDHVPDRIAQFVAGVSGHSICLGLRIGSTDWKRPWSAETRPDQAIVAEHLEALPIAARHGKLDGVVANAIWGGIEASNVLLWIEPGNQESGASSRSFAFQEAAISSSQISWMPRRLENPESIGTYLKFLCAQIEYYLARDLPVKAAKRALSLSVFLLYADYADALRGLLSNGDAIIQDAVRQRGALLDELESLDEKEAAAMCSEVRRGFESLKRAAVGNGESLGKFATEARSIISKLLAEVGQPWEKAS
jgi:hypothetical protein